MKRGKRWREIGQGLGVDLLRMARSSSARAPYLDILRHVPEWTRMIPWIIEVKRGTTWAEIARRNAQKHGPDLAFLTREVRWTWADVETRVSARAHALSALGISAGDVVAVLAGSTPDYLVAVLALCRIGAVSALINTSARGRVLEHAVSAAKSKLVLVDAEHACLKFEIPVLEFDQLEAAARRMPSSAFPVYEADEADDFLYIYTSGTTGLPKPCRVSHGRALLAGAGAGIVGFRFGQRLSKNDAPDLLYCVLPLYHANGLLLGAGSCLTTRTPMAIRDGFSARAFWPDVQFFGATAFNYIGELGRYLVQSPHGPSGPHSLRVAFGNGLRAEIWTELQGRFGIASIREFYAATESPGGFFNLSERPGSVGHLPFRHVGWLRLARYDVEQDELIRDDDGFLMDCAPGEAGELLVRLADNPMASALDFRGYTDEAATRRRVLHDAFREGDRFFRTGDLLRHDEDDYFFFVDRIGDTYRWKGENVSTQEVGDVIGALVRVQSALVVGVEVPGQEGRAGLAVVVPESPDAFSVVLKALAAAPLAPFARPRFVRFVDSLITTGTHKLNKSALREFHPETLSDVFYWTGSDYETLTAEVWQQIQEGDIRL